MAAIRSVRRRWRAKQYITAAMLGTLLAIALVATTSIILAPAHIQFLVTKADIIEYNRNPANRTQVTNTHLNLILQANNTSHSTSVGYGAVSVEIWYGPAATAWIRTRVHMNEGLHLEWHPPRSVVNISVSADYGYVPQSRVTDHCRVVVVSTLWFRYGLARTRPFTINFSCLDVNFVDNTNFPVVCGG